MKIVASAIIVGSVSAKGVKSCHSDELKPSISKYVSFFIPVMSQPQAWGALVIFRLLFSSVTISSKLLGGRAPCIKQTHLGILIFLRECFR